MMWHGEGLTDIGRVRKVNQDAFGVHDSIQLWVVADGMGGHVGGEVASRLVVETIGPYVAKCTKKDSTHLIAPNDRETCLCEAIETANKAIRSHAQNQRELTGMGTTAVVLQISDHDPCQATIAHAGDSRAYLIRNQSIALLTRDHSLVEERIELGIITSEQALTHPLRHVLTKALGIEALVEPAVKTVELQSTDLLLLCTDGLTKMMTDDKILEILLRHQTSLEHICQALVTEANQLGGDDNVTVVVVRGGDRKQNE